MSDENIRSLTMQVDHGRGAVGTISDSAEFNDGGLEWCLRYGPHANNYNIQAASVVRTFDYLLSDNINMKEATRRLRQMRAARLGRIKPDNQEADNE